MVTLVLPEFAAIYKTFNTPLPLLTQAVMGLAALVDDQRIAQRFLHLRTELLLGFLLLRKLTAAGFELTRQLARLHH